MSSPLLQWEVYGVLFKHKKHQSCIIKTKDKKAKFNNGLFETDDKELIKVLQANPDVEEVKAEDGKGK